MTSHAKDIIQYGSAVGMLLLGSGLTIAGFALSTDGEIHDSVLWLFAQTLLYSGSIFGVSIYMKERFSTFEKKIQNKLDNVTKVDDTDNKKL